MSYKTKMSDVFNPLAIVTGKDIDSWELKDINGNLYAVFYNHQACISAAKAVGAYDANQEHIAELEAELLRQRQGHVNLIALEIIPTRYVDSSMNEIVAIDKLLDGKK
ncbi:MAG: hypothetical protein JKY89_13295 [Immundisolibacteraceae bacterium]|nr:hypothetical protein [Immundisolibacteraceae bacterium]